MNAIQTISVARENALAELDRLRGEFASSGLYPILVGDSEDRDRVLGGVAAPFDPAETLQYAETIDAAEWLESKLKLDPDIYENVDDGEWPGAVDQMGIVTHMNLGKRNPKREVFVAMLKLAAPWEAFAYLNWGGWNDCPQAAVHCALHRYWASCYGAEVVSITGDVVQCIVSRPPADPPASLALAREQFIYCCDIVVQNVGTISALGANLWRAKYWYFWWD